ncbi:MAG: zf-HC2 domain-containing protein [Eubacteriales bacterium]|nr:zf-HC2 domain-containing protein [Eubacteriales bacterium]
MDCREIQKSFIPFIDDKLSIRELEAFLKHMESCQNCREEYDIYYTMIAGMRYLESDNMEAFRFDSWQKLQSAEDYLIKYKIVLAEKIIIFVLLCLGAVLLL